MERLRAWTLWIAMASLTVACGREEPGPIGDHSDAAEDRSLDLEDGLEFAALQQNWTPAESEEFYSLPQGSKLVPYAFFLNLEREGTEELFLTNGHMRELGFLPRHPNRANPDGLPVGLVKDPAPTGAASLGLTCAACHTGQINMGGKAYLIDGGPSLADLETFLKRLAGALRATASDDAKFARFQARVIGAGATPDQEAELRQRLEASATEREGYNARNFPGADDARIGHGRVDAFGAIMNEVTVRFLEVPENVRPASAPVSFPALWDTPQHDRVQWNGVAKNTELPVAVAGTKQIGALGRNIGEVLGVFGSVDLSSSDGVGYDSSINRPSLIRLEELATTLWSPQWPLGLDDELVSKGAAVYKSAKCASCHGDPAQFDRTSASRKVRAVMVDVGTDPTMFMNVATRVGQTGLIRGRTKGLNPFSKFGDKAAFDEIIAHVVGRVMFGDRQAGEPELPAGADPYEATFSHVIAGFDIEDTGILMGDFDDVAYDAATGNYSFAATSDVAFLDSTDEDPHPLADDYPELKLRGDWAAEYASRARTTGGDEGIAEVAKRLDSARGVYRIKAASDGTGGVALHEVSRPEDIRTSPKWLRSVTPTADDPAGRSAQRFELLGAKPRVAYKARPLNGIWATAPYLHNGSVPNLSELLKAPDERTESFFVGSRDYDAAKVGLASGSGSKFDTTKPGNSNAGHPFGGHLSEDQKLQLIEYLKTL